MFVLVLLMSMTPIIIVMKSFHSVTSLYTCMLDCILSAPFHDGTTLTGEVNGILLWCNIRAMVQYDLVKLSSSQEAQ